MELISVTFDVLKLLRFRLVNLSQFENMLVILDTFDVSKLLTSRFVKLLQPFLKFFQEETAILPI